MAERNKSDISGYLIRSLQIGHFAQTMVGQTSLRFAGPPQKLAGSSVGRRSFHSLVPPYSVRKVVAATQF